jgi:hypothetical protein
MDAKELRIGNHILNDGFADEIHHGYEIDDAIHQFEPIPITEEWLLKYGFEHDQDQEIWNHENICISYISDYPMRGFKLYANHEYEIGAPFKYVHQLQNLYFALTNQELIIEQ